MRVLGNLTSAQANVEEVTVSSSEELGGDNASDTTLVTQKAVKTYVDSRVINTSSTPTVDLSINVTDNTPIGQTLSQNPDDTSKQHWFFNDEVGFQYNNVELTNTSFGISSKININTTANPKVDFKSYYNVDNTTNTEQKNLVTTSNRSTFKKMIAKHFLQKHIVYRYTTSDWDTALGSNYQPQPDTSQAARYRSQINGFLAFMPMTAHGVPSPASFRGSNFTPIQTNAWTTTHLRQDNSYRKDCTGRAADANNARAGTSIGGSGRNVFNNEFNLSNFMSK